MLFNAIQAVSLGVFLGLRRFTHWRRGTQHNEWMAGGWPIEQTGRGTVVSARVKLPTAMAFIAEETLKSSMFEAQMRKVAAGPKV